MLKVGFVSLEHFTVLHNFHNKIISGLMIKILNWRGLRTVIKLEIREVSSSWSEIIVMQSDIDLFQNYHQTTFSVGPETDHFSVHNLFSWSSVIAHEILWNVLLVGSILLAAVWFPSVIITAGYIVLIWALLCSWSFMYINSFNLTTQSPGWFYYTHLTTKKIKEERN